MSVGSVGVRPRNPDLLPPTLMLTVEEVLDLPSTLNAFTVQGVVSGRDTLPDKDVRSRSGVSEKRASLIEFDLVNGYVKIGNIRFDSQVASSRQCRILRWLSDLNSEHFRGHSDVHSDRTGRHGTMFILDGVGKLIFSENWPAGVYRILPSTMVAVPCPG